MSARFWPLAFPVRASSSLFDGRTAALYADGVATFYRSFSLEPRGRHVCTVCLGTACHVRGGAAVLEQFERKLGIPAGATTPDGKYTLERVNCLGACALAPLAVIDGRYYSRMTEAKAEAVLAAIEKDEGA